MDDKQTLRLYEEILKGAQMGIDSIDEMLRKCDDQQFQEELIRTQNDYKYIAEEADEGVQRFGGTPHELSAMTRVNTWGRITAALFMDHTPERMSSMILGGMEMADQEMNKHLQEYAQADEAAKSLAHRLLDLQNAQRSVYRKYLN